MARIRSIKPEFPHSQSMGRVSRDARLCFVLLWTLADDEGRLRGNSRMLASLLFPYDDDAAKKISGWLGELEAEDNILRYLVGADDYVQICNWLKHQKIDKPTRSRLPAFDESSPNPREPSPTTRDVSSEEGSGREGKGEEGRTVMSGSSPDPISLDAEKRKRQRRELHETACKVLEVLNRNAGRNYQPVDANLGLIVARLREGYSESELKAICAVKARQWGTDPKMGGYLRPKTLFNASNAAQYRGELPTSQREAADA